jgi:membrane fusion protein, multidrug efflux system
LRSLCSGLTVLMAVLGSCGKTEKVEARNPGASGSSEVSVGVVKIGRKPLARSLTLSSELVPFQEIDVFAKESGFVKELPVDYGTHVQKGQLIATLEIPELQSQLRQDDAAIKNASEQITHAQNELERVEAQHKVMQ